MIWVKITSVYRKKDDRQQLFCRRDNGSLSVVGNRPSVFTCGRLRRGDRPPSCHGSLDQGRILIYSMFAMPQPCKINICILFLFHCLRVSWQIKVRYFYIFILFATYTFSVSFFKYYICIALNIDLISSADRIMQTSF